MQKSIWSLRFTIFYIFLTLLLLYTGCSSTSLRLPSDEEERLNKEIKAILQGTGKNDISFESIVSELGFIWPLQGEVLEPKGTEGINIRAHEGQPVKATKSGIVTFVSDNMTGYGKTVTVKHSDGFISLYAYNSEILVKENQVVKQGDIIAKAGKTGRATHAQLHFRLFKGGTPVNPLNYLP
jgi:murein DD-endopeptidase MepM/ murein hydrolase activator NlpD